MQERIVVGWDGSPAAAAALEWAVTRHARSGGDLLLVRALPESTGKDRRLEDEDDLDRSRRELEEAAEELRRARPVGPVYAESPFGEPADVLLPFAAPDTVLVVGGARRGGSRRQGWSVGARLASRAGGPVVIVPADGGAGRSGVVAGVDGSTLAQQALLFAAEEAQSGGDELHVVHAWLEPSEIGDELASDPGFSDWVEGSHASVLEEVVSPIRAQFPELTVRAHLEHGPVAPTILGHSASARLTVVGSRHRDAVRRFLLGSVSHALVLHATGPLAVVGALDE
ncbi:universal stress protein [Naasia aerilata]|uniref:Universal stress protein n=1 Tax=Naasia aerilata TaxID=1162966 RepID=A0ABM8GF03_9MICO|nr:universal stress protein [Naasia aerilata]BDZ46922.1 universal stress protein [Naasia aerilata]